MSIINVEPYIASLDHRRSHHHPGVHPCSTSRRRLCCVRWMQGSANVLCQCQVLLKVWAKEDECCQRAPHAARQLLGLTASSTSYKKKKFSVKYVERGKWLDKITIRLWKYASVLWIRVKVSDYSDTTLILIHHGMFTPLIYLQLLTDFLDY